MLLLPHVLGSGVMLCEQAASGLCRTGVWQGRRNSVVVYTNDGFYAFESALHVFPFSMIDCNNQQDLLRWNSPDLWRHKYGPDADNLFFFAEDIFGYQFCFSGNRVGRFDPETGSVDDICRTIEKWASIICQDFEFHTGYRIAHEWQAAKGPVSEGNRLVPIIPLITKEGAYELSNFYEVMQ
jgi:hypothetical protein